MNSENQYANFNNNDRIKELGFKEYTTVQKILKESISQDVSQIVNTKSYGSLWQISEITENLLLCSAASINQKVLKDLNVACIINAASELPDLPLDTSSLICHNISVLDTSYSDISQYLDEVADLIHKVASTGERSLVYCVAGVSRSATLCIAYIMKHCGLTLLEAYEHVKQRRPKIKPNCNFFRQLIAYERSILKQNSVHMIFNEIVQMEIPSVYECNYKFFPSFRKKSAV